MTQVSRFCLAGGVLWLEASLGCQEVYIKNVTLAIRS